MQRRGNSWGIFIVSWENPWAQFSLKTNLLMGARRFPVKLGKRGQKELHFLEKFPLFFPTISYSAGSCPLAKRAAVGFRKKWIQCVSITLKKPSFLRQLRWRHAKGIADTSRPLPFHVYNQDVPSALRCTVRRRCIVDVDRQVRRWRIGFEFLRLWSQISLTGTSRRVLQVRDNHPEVRLVMRIIYM